MFADRHRPSPTPNMHKVTGKGYLIHRRLFQETVFVGLLYLIPYVVLCLFFGLIIRVVNKCLEVYFSSSERKDVRVFWYVCV